MYYISALKQNRKMNEKHEKDMITKKESNKWILRAFMMVYQFYLP